MGEVASGMNYGVAGMVQCTSQEFSYWSLTTASLGVRSYSLPFTEEEIEA